MTWRTINRLASVHYGGFEQQRRQDSPDHRSPNNIQVDRPTPRGAQQCAILLIAIDGPGKLGLITCIVQSITLEYCCAQVAKCLATTHYCGGLSEGLRQSLLQPRCEVPVGFNVLPLFKPSLELIFSDCLLKGDSSLQPSLPQQPAV